MVYEQMPGNLAKRDTNSYVIYKVRRREKTVYHKLLIYGIGTKNKDTLFVNSAKGTSERERDFD